MPNIPRNVKRWESVANMNTLLMKCNEIFRTTSPGEMTCELFSKKLRIHFKNNVGVLQTKRTRQASEKCKIFSLIVGIFIPEETTRCCTSYASTKTTIISRPHSGTPAPREYCTCALTTACPVRPVDCDPWSWQRRKIRSWRRCLLERVGQQRTSHGHCKLTSTRSLNSTNEKKRTPRLHIDIPDGSKESNNASHHTAFPSFL